MKSSTILTINHQHIPLADDANVDELVRAVVGAVHDGGGFVRIIGRHGDQYDVLITAATPVMVRHGSMAFESSATGATSGPWITSIDLDM